VAGLASPGPAARPLGPALVRFTGRGDGDVGARAARPEADRRRRAVVDRPWCWVRQVHGATVAWAGPEHPDADAVITDRRDCAVAVFTADCAPIALASPEGVLAAVHAGWRGLAAGVVEAAVSSLHAAGASAVWAAVGPCIHPCCYEFSDRDLNALVDRYGAPARAMTTWGRAALDLPATVAAALAGAGAEVVSVSDACTACSPGYFSHRARQEKERQAGVVWLA
jgi:YfiH family protein